MSKAEWLLHADKSGYTRMTVEDRLIHARQCAACKARLATKRANRAQRERDEARRDLGLVKTPYGWE